jgi:hypothetical protein
MENQEKKPMAVSVSILEEAVGSMKYQQADLRQR